MLEQDKNCAWCGKPIKYNEKYVKNECLDNNNKTILLNFHKKCAIRMGNSLIESSINESHLMLDYARTTIKSLLNQQFNK